MENQSELHYVSTSSNLDGDPPDPASEGGEDNQNSVFEPSIPSKEEEGGEEDDKRQSNYDRSFSYGKNPSSVVRESDPFDPETYRYKIKQANRCVGVFGFGTRKEQPGDVVATLKKYGEIEKYEFIKDPRSGKFRGYGFVYFKNIEDAKKVVELANCKGMIVGGLRIRLDFSKSSDGGSKKPFQSNVSANEKIGSYHHSKDRHGTKDSSASRNHNNGERNARNRDSKRNRSFDRDRKGDYGNRNSRKKRSRSRDQQRSKNSHASSSQLLPPPYVQPPSYYQGNPTGTVPFLAQPQQQQASQQQSNLYPGPYPPGQFSAYAQPYYQQPPGGIIPGQPQQQLSSSQLQQSLPQPQLPPGSFQRPPHNVIGPASGGSVTQNPGTWSYPTPPNPSFFDPRYHQQHLLSTSSQPLSLDQSPSSIKVSGGFPPTSNPPPQLQTIQQQAAHGSMYDQSRYNSTATYDPRAFERR